MAEPLEVHSFYGQVVSNLKPSRVPDMCPRCHRHVDPLHRISYYPRDESKLLFESVFQCTNILCGKLFIVEYSRVGPSERYNIARLSPCEATQVEFSTEISEVSPTFITIYNQAIQAESLGLTHIAGMGLGKALEFLVKDFAIEQNPNDEAEIKKKLLGACIKTYVTDVSVQTVAKRAAWLRNDETHYVRKWEGKDISDLKNLIRLTVNAIENIKLADKYVSDMPDL